MGDRGWTRHFLSKWPATSPLRHVEVHPAIPRERRDLGIWLHTPVPSSRSDEVQVALEAGDLGTRNSVTYSQAYLIKMAGSLNDGKQSKKKGTKQSTRQSTGVNEGDSGDDLCEIFDKPMAGESIGNNGSEGDQHV